MGNTLTMLGYLKGYLTFLCENHFYILSYQKNLEDLKNGKNNFTLKPIYNLQNMTVTKPPMTLQKFRAQKYDKFVKFKAILNSASKFGWLEILAVF
jgi:hypothetical protein